MIPCRSDGISICPLITIAIRALVSDESSIPVSRITFCLVRGSAFSAPSFLAYPMSSGVIRDNSKIGRVVSPDLAFQRFDDCFSFATGIHQNKRLQFEPVERQFKLVTRFIIMAVHDENLSSCLSRNRSWLCGCGTLDSLSKSDPSDAFALQLNGPSGLPPI